VTASVATAEEAETESSASSTKPHGSSIASYAGLGSLFCFGFGLLQSCRGGCTGFCERDSGRITQRTNVAWILQIHTLG
jgi:hypothetical protein